MEIETRGSSCSPEPDVENSLKIYREVFDLCDKDGNGYISREELAQICEQSTNHDGDGAGPGGLLDTIMQCLDQNNDGHITFEEFKEGFEKFQRLHLEGQSAIASSTPHKPVTEEVYESDPIPDRDEMAWREVAERIDPQGTLSGTGVGTMWKELNHAQDATLLENFESFLTEVITELKQSDLEKSTLQTHVKRIMEQHSREVREMDSLLQEELQQANINHQQTSASQTSRLSDRYSSLLADREAKIDQLATHETDLKQALHRKSLNESQLKQEKNYLLSENKVLQEKLETTLRSESNSRSGSGSEGGHSPRVNGRGRGEESQDDSESDEFEDAASLPHTDAHRETKTANGMNSSSHSSARMEYRQGISLEEEKLRLNVASDGEQEEVKYYPPKKSPLHPQKLNHSHNSSVQTDPRFPRRQLFSDTSQGTSSSQDISSSSQINGLRSSASSQGNGIRSSRSEAGMGNSRKVGSWQSTVGSSADMSLTISGVIPRRDELPRPSSPQAVSRVFKVIFLGDSGVGKTSLITFLSEGKFRNSVVSTLGLDYSTKTLRVGDERVVFQLWDTAGQERFHNTLTPVYFRRADAFVIVYDVSNVETFKATKKWISVIKAALREQPPILMLVGNKSDRTKERCVSIEDGRKLALELQALFSETSALSGDNVLQAHSTLAQLLLARENADIQEMKNRATTLNSSQRKNCAC